MDYVKYFEELEKAREEGRVDDALLKSQQALLESARLHDPILAVNSLGHQLLILKDQFTKTGDEFYLHLMHGVCQAGITLCLDLQVTGQPLAVMLLRSGDYYFHLKKYAEAVVENSKALQKIGSIQNEKPGEYAEYVSHLGKAQVYAGQREEGFERLKSAVEITAGKTELRDFHQKTVHSGNLARLALCLLLDGQKDEAISLVKQIKPIALDLKENYHLPLRWEELVSACAKFNINLDGL